MLLLTAPHPHSAGKFTSAPISGLRSLLVDTHHGEGVVTRAAVAARGCGCGGLREDAEESRDVDDDGRPSVARDGEDVETAEEEGVEVEERDGEDDELGGLWVSYGRRRLPPPIPSLVARGALRRTRTDDGRLVIRIVPVVWPDRVRTRRRCDDRPVEPQPEDSSPVTAAPPLPEPMASAREDGVVRVSSIAQADDDAAAPAAGEVAHDVEVEHAAAAPAETRPAAAPSPRVPSVGCFEEVFKLASIGGSSLHQMPSLRMVH